VNVSNADKVIDRKIVGVVVERSLGKLGIYNEKGVKDKDFSNFFPFL
jgi:hypothetical protein